MSSPTFTALGQVTFRKDLLYHLGVHPGEKLSVQKLRNGRMEFMETKPTGQISDAFNMLKSKTSIKLSVDEMKAIAAQGWADKN
jgi:uncharacterized protein YfkK (UPF0435 family)